MATFHFELVSPDKISFSGEVDQVDVPGAEGDFGVLAGHAPLIALLRPGLMTVYAGGEQTKLVVLGGFAEVGPDGLTVLADVATSLEDLDRAALQAQIAEMETRVKDMAGLGARPRDRQARSLQGARYAGDVAPARRTGRCRRRSRRWSRTSRRWPRALNSTRRSRGSTTSVLDQHLDGTRCIGAARMMSPAAGSAALSASRPVASHDRLHTSRTPSPPAHRSRA